jgi:hypothetical protein
MVPAQASRINAAGGTGLAEDGGVAAGGFLDLAGTVVYFATAFNIGPLAVAVSVAP